MDRSSVLELLRPLLLLDDLFIAVKMSSSILSSSVGAWFASIIFRPERIRHRGAGCTHPKNHD